MLLDLGLITVCVCSPQPLNFLVKGFKCLADAARHTQQWHCLAGTLAGVTETDIKQASQISLPGDNAAELATAVQNVTCKLGRIADLVYELADLRLVVPALTSVQIQDDAVQLVFLGVEAELKFSVQLRIGQPCLSPLLIAFWLHSNVLVQGLSSCCILSECLYSSNLMFNIRFRRIGLSKVCRQNCPACYCTMPIYRLVQM